MSETLLDAVIVEPAAPARVAVIWLHGLGADGHDFEAIVPALGIPAEAGVRFVFPHAPKIPVTINGGLVMPAWYDISELDLRRRADEVGVRRSAAAVEALIARERAAGIEAEKIVVAGFSQGGAIALHVGLRHAERLAGIMALSTYLVCEDSLEAERTDANLDVPIFQAHGTHDDMVPIDRGLDCRRRLEELGYTVEWHDYPMAHQVCPEQIAELAGWLRRSLA